MIDLIEMKSIVWKDEAKGAEYVVEGIPADLKEQVEAAREKMIEVIADADDEIATKYLEGPRSIAEIRAALRRGCIAIKLVPVVCGSAFKNKGVQPLLDAVIDYLPSPMDIAAVEGVDMKAKRSSARPMTRSRSRRSSSRSWPTSTSASFPSRAFTPARSKRARTCSTRPEGSSERVGRIMKMHANKREDVDEAYAGEIVAVAGLKQVTTGDTICAESHPVILEAMEFPQPVISLAIEPKTRPDQEKLGIALGRLAQEDPSFRVTTDRETNQTIISGMGELHLEIIVDRLKREYSVEANVGKPQVAYRETIRKPAKGEEKYVRQTGGRGQYGHAVLEIAPNRRAPVSSSLTRSSEV